MSVATEIPSTYGELAAFASPRAHMRIQVTKNTKGYSYETSVSADGDDPTMVATQIAQLLRDADTIARQEIARQEIARREFIDENPMATAAIKGMLADGSDGPDVAVSR